MAEKKGGWMWVVVIILLVLGVWYWYMKMYPQTGSTTTETQTEQTVPGEVIIKRNAFAPATMTIKVGETVTWVNQETYGHDVVSDDGSFVSPKMATGDKYSYTFKKPGTYTYICGIHPFMHAVIIVTQ